MARGRVVYLHVYVYVCMCMCVRRCIRPLTSETPNARRDTYPPGHTICVDETKLQLCKSTSICPMPIPVVSRHHPYEWTGAWWAMMLQHRSHLHHHHRHRQPNYHDTSPPPTTPLRDLRPHPLNWPAPPHTLTLTLTVTPWPN